MTGNLLMRVVANVEPLMRALRRVSVVASITAFDFAVMARGLSYHDKTVLLNLARRERLRQLGLG